MTLGPQRGRGGTARRAWLTLAAAACLACGGDGGGGVTPPLGPPAPPPPYDVAQWVQASDGTIPLVIVAPHGGDLSPDSLADRSCAACITGNDLGTQALAVAIADAFQARVGRRPFVVINRLHRRKFDANRELAEATGGDARLEPFWALFHERIDSAKARAVQVHPRALLVDLHGHSHAIARLELGFLLSAANLRLADASLDPLLVASSLSGLHASAAANASGAALLRGPSSLGARFAALGVPAVPSDATPAPLVGEEYFSGGYNTNRHGSRFGGAVDAVQVEAHYVGVRDTPSSRAAFAEQFVTALLQYLADHYDWTPTP